MYSLKPFIYEHRIISLHGTITDNPTKGKKMSCEAMRTF